MSDRIVTLWRIHARARALQARADRARPRPDRERALWRLRSIRAARSRRVERALARAYARLAATVSGEDTAEVTQ